MPRLLDAFDDRSRRGAVAAASSPLLKPANCLMAHRRRVAQSIYQEATGHASMEAGWTELDIVSTQTLVDPE